MNKLIMLVGLPASGKSTLAEKLSKEYDAEIVSSDEIRKELFNDINDQTNNDTVFNVMHERVIKLLNADRSAIYDATNLNRKRRKHLINHVFKADQKIVYYINESIGTVLCRDSERERNVGEKIISKMYKNLHIPVEGEGWDKVIYVNYYNDGLLRLKKHYEEVITTVHSHDELFGYLTAYISEFSEILNLPQDSSYHSFSVSRHTYYVHNYILENYHNEDRLILLWASLFHDIGKSYCKSFTNFKGEETKYANFIGHEYVSSQIAAKRLGMLGYDENFIKKIVTLVQFHMMPMRASEKKMNEINRLIGDDLYAKLMILSEADTQAK